MNTKKIYVARHNIVNLNGKVIGYELLFRDSPTGITEFPSSNLKATSVVLLNTLTHMDFSDIIGDDKVAFLNCDHRIFETGIIEILDPKKFVLEILETAEISEALRNKIIALKQKGYIFAIDDFDCSKEMIQKFNILFKYVNYIKIDISIVNKENLLKLLPKFKELKIELLAERVETKEEFQYYTSLGFSLFQGFYFAKPEIIEMKTYKEVTRTILLSLLAIVKQDKEIDELERVLKTRPELVFNLLKFINNRMEVKTKITSINHAITILGRSDLIKWILIYIYAEVSDNENSESILEVALNRSAKMEKSYPEDGNKAFITGMLSIMSLLLESPIQDIISKIPLDKEIVDSLLYRRGKIGTLLNNVENEERNEYQKIIFDNFSKIDFSDLFILANHVKQN